MADGFEILQKIDLDRRALLTATGDGPYQLLARWDATVIKAVIREFCKLIKSYNF